MATLNLVATPIGNLEDVTLRALRVLREAALILAEDTRHARTLLTRHGIAQKPVSLHAHNEASRVERALGVLEAGGDVALVSDAGTPLVSDPGERLVREAIRAGHAVTAVPGPSAVLAALTVAGLGAERFTFVGFLPRKAGERDALIERLTDADETLVFFESPRRLAETLERLTERLGPRRACVARELTKLHEEVARGTLAELAERFAAGVRGEVTLVVEGAPPAEPPRLEDLDGTICAALAAGESARDLADRLSVPGLSRRRVYARINALRGSRAARSGGPRR
ncbi:MAG: 16S rRNA (cytidine(1402)-2'-O)-methyltransferase [Myxococcota bacterium]|nr:16S rRNA (cytidine(1402)-2'-O)-methyltransferase [Deltaproteobacteria bacterium]MCP4243337.1 16S rRNA (cytidine(1402)-2'-O)-methyltransferase [bacterium]MDP6073699.1 16S rRNA (cytidine(1402)-2'-O)-methyltransferase [Myxococcota bacterium]MDP6243796.1 16S rRNA (cytidine(1402)-2'-O)-methyltransferase [Myxococcota bacterium]MDP7076392.1 16S rRNA (cytidine(1402)-2'-O)-methyltransferase [Myxococcota bacterium]